MNTFKKRLERFVANARKDNAIKAYEILDKNVKADRIVSINLTFSREYGEPDDRIIVDYSVDLTDGKNISDLGVDSIEDAITEIAQDLEERYP